MNGEASTSLERNLTAQEREAVERERRSALRALFDYFKALRFAGQPEHWLQLSFEDGTGDHGQQDKEHAA